MKKNILTYKSFVEKRLNEIKNSDIPIEKMNTNICNLTNDEKEILHLMEETPNDKKTQKKKNEIKEDLKKQIKEYRNQINLLFDDNKKNNSK